MTPEEPLTSAVQAHLAKLSDALAPYACGRYLNFVEESYDLREVYGEEGFRRLQAVKAEYDPDGVFHANHPITTTP